ncbi:AMP-dependent synthetase/ligase [Mameliella sediminis]|uniref:AMP-dependent synthetase/ligase n=1 Tax=Mameliella sediminis TaxID=2836866 RepID=UPI001C44471D|nr:AMP-binding protein [Mameliella sediminis]MBV7397257.1 AMP-binding protein [Mameliella sediminis]MBY6146875.1 AMP-binding protein [Mameliella alba]MCA0956761.1 AMP-binding protein [Mameliella alba]
MNQISSIDGSAFDPKVHRIDGCDTVPKLFLKKAAERGDRIAMREKDFGLWQTYSWKDFHDRAMRIAHGLRKLGLNKGDVVSILSEDCKEWVWADMGVMLAGGTVNGIYPTYQPAQLSYVLSDSGTRVLFVEGEEQLDKYIEIRDEVPGVEAVFFFDDKGLRTFRDDRIQPIEHLYETGGLAWREHPGEIEKIVADTSPDDLGILCYTSGTTGRPKGAMIPQRALVFQMTLAPDHFRIGPDDELLTYLPLCHVAERLFSLCMPLATGATINFAESPDSVPQNLKELSPTVVFGVPRIWEKSYSRINTLMSEATWIGKTVYGLARKLGERRADKLIAGQPLSPLDRLGFALADRLVFHNIKQLIGLDRAQFLASGAAPISESLLRWYLSLGLPIVEVYGQTEMGIATLTRAGTFKPGTVGPAVPGVSLKLAESGEILIRSDGGFTGYLNLPEKTAETLVDGWIHTGDVGQLDEDGSLRITDRIKDIIITAGGKNITPSQIENELKFSPYISDSVVVGDKRKYLTVLIMIDKENVEHFAQMNAIPFTDYRSLCARPEIVDLIDGEIAKVNTRFSPVEQIKKFRLIDVLLTAEDEELTPTMKLKRSFVSEKYSALIDQMYGA